MSALIVLLSLPLSHLAFAQNNTTVNVTIQAGQSIHATVDGCAPGTYGALSIESSKETNTETLTSKCLPKVCVYRYYYRFHGMLGMVTVYPGEKVIIEGRPKSEVKELLKTYLKDGTCAEAHPYVPSM